MIRMVMRTDFTEKQTQRRRDGSIRVQLTTQRRGERLGRDCERGGQ